MARKLGVTATPPADDKSAVALAAAVATLQSKSGTEFDRACITQELAFHRSAIDVVTNTLLPNVELKALLKTVLEGSSTISPRLEPSPASSACIKLARHGRLAIA